MAACLIAACDSGDAQQAGSPSFAGAYIDPSQPRGTVRLNLSEDGTFSLILCERGEGGAVDQEHDIGHGSWRLLGDSVQLDGAAWTASLVSDEIPVSLPVRSDTLAGLRWSSVFGSAPVQSGGFMRYGEFADFVHPPGGSGTSPGGL